MASQTYKVVLVGSVGAGKTSWLRRLRDGIFLADYTPTKGADVYSETLNLNNKTSISLSIWDTAGDGSGMGEGYIVGADAVVLFMSPKQSPNTRNNYYNYWTSLIRQIRGNIPVIVVTTMSDVSRPNLKNEQAKLCFRSIQVSSRSCYNLYRPLRDLARGLTGNRTVELLNESGMVQREPLLSLATMREYESRLATQTVA